MSPADAGSKVLAGEPSPYEDEAIYYVPARAFDHGLPDVPVHAFHDELDLVLDPSAPTGITVLDLSRSLALPFPATTPMLLARYCVIRPGERLVHRFGGTGEVHYVLRGHGASTNDGHSIDWGEGDCFSFAGGGETTHRAGGGESTHRAGGDVLLFSVTNEPELDYAHTVPRADAPVSPTVWRSARIDAELTAVHGASSPQATAGKSVSFSTPAMNKLVSGAMLPSMMVAVNSLEPGGVQRLHRHNSVAITVAISGDGIYSLIGDEKVEWRRFGVMVTPPRLPHSHVNPGPEMMRSLVVQDGPLFYYCRSVGFEWLEEER